MSTDTLYIQNKRIKRDLDDIHNNKDSYYQIIQEETDKLRFYFLFCGGEKNSFEGGYYIWYIQLSKDYPFGTSDYYMLTPSGRMTINNKICFTNSSFYSEASAESTALPVINVLSFFLQFYSCFNDELDNSGHIGHLHNVSKESRKTFAKNSVKYNIDNYKELLLKFDRFKKEENGVITLKTPREVEEYLKKL